jgi:HEAT repeat protein
MPTVETIAARFARCVNLFRDPGAKDTQKAEFRALVELLKDTAVTLRSTGGGIDVNGIACDGAAFGQLAQRLDFHGVAEVELPADPPAAQLFELLRVLADQPGTEDIARRLATAGAHRIRVVLAPPPDATPPPPVASPDDFDYRDAVLPGPDAPPDRASRSLGTEGILRGESWRDIKSVPIRGVPLVTHDPPAPPAADALPESGRAAPPPDTRAPADLSLSVGRTREPAPPGPPATPPSAPAAAASATPVTPARPAPSAPPPVPAASTAPLALPSGAAALLAELERNRTAPMVGDVLAALVQHAETAAKQKRSAQLLGVIAGIIRVERGVPETSGVRRQYGIALRRIYSKAVLDLLAHLLSEPEYRADAVAALQRGGADAVEVLLDRLVAAPTVAERRGAFDALRQMTEGTEQLVHMLDHQEWFVVRNVAELLGELGMEEAVPALARRLDHADERVRKAVALALAKIGTRSVAEPLHRALRDPAVDVRMQVALGIGGRKSLALAMPLVVAMEEEKDEAVVRELILALGRIGSPDAVQALIKCAQPAGRIFGRKPVALRLAAVEGLRLAGTPAAYGTLEGLADDGDRQVRAAARAAVAQLARKPRT